MLSKHFKWLNDAQNYTGCYAFPLQFERKIFFFQFFLDGYDSVSAQLILIFYYLALNREAQVSVLFFLSWSF